MVKIGRRKKFKLSKKT